MTAGLLVERGLLSAEAAERGAALAASVAAQGIETIRVLFPDQHGILRGKAIAARTLGSLFATGLSVPSTLILKDTAHRTVFDVWRDGLTLDGVPLAGGGDLLLVPDPDTFAPLPWSPHSAILLCDLAYRRGGRVVGHAPAPCCAAPSSNWPTAGVCLGEWGWRSSSRSSPSTTRRWTTARPPCRRRRSGPATPRRAGPS